MAGRFTEWLNSLTAKTTTIDGTETSPIYNSSGTWQKATLSNQVSNVLKSGAVIGGATNNVTISSAGAITLNGTAKITHHAQLPFTAIVVGTANAVYNSGVVAGPLLNANSDILYTTTELYPSWDGTNVVFEIDWTPTTDITNGQTVLFNWSWKAIAEGEDADTGTAATYTATYTSSGTTSAGTMIHTPCVMAYNNANQPLTVGDHIHVKLLRDATGDTFGGDIIATAFEFIYTANGLSGA